MPITGRPIKVTEAMYNAVKQQVGLKNAAKYSVIAKGWNISKTTVERIAQTKDYEGYRTGTYYQQKDIRAELESLRATVARLEARQPAMV